LVTDIFGMKTDKEVINSLEDNIQKREAMSKVISDRALSKIGNKVKDILRALLINDWQSDRIINTRIMQNGIILP
jgi:hypothetical protein